MRRTVSLDVTRSVCSCSVSCSNGPLNVVSHTKTRTGISSGEPWPWKRRLANEMLESGAALPVPYLRGCLRRLIYTAMRV